MSGHLFNGMPVDSRIKEERASLAAEISRLTDPDTLNEDRAGLGEAARIQSCTIDRANAKFEVKESATTVSVTLTIPVSGDRDLLRLRVSSNVGENVLVRGDVRQDHPWGDQPKEGPRVEIQESFPVGTTTAEVRDKVKRSADAIEANLSHINALVERHNATVAEEVERLVAHRRQVLETGASLRDDLGSGI